MALKRDEIKSLNELLASKRAAIMGIVNVTPDSFSDGGKFVEHDAAVAQALKLIDEGADILDIGGESTRPGAPAVAEQEELDRVIPIVETLRQQTDVPISVDTSKPSVMRAAIVSGANFINDVTALSHPQAIDVVSSAGVGVCLMHMQGSPRTMQDSPQYDNVVDDVISYLQARITQCVDQGIAHENILVDPGIGFGKTLEHNLCLLHAINQISTRLGCPVLIGVSRKSLIQALLGRPVNERLAASLGLAVQAALNGAAILRVHDVRETYDAVRSAEAVRDIVLT